MKRMMAAVMLVCLLSIQGCQREQENQESVHTFLFILCAVCDIGGDDLSRHPRRAPGAPGRDPGAGRRRHRRLEGHEHDWNRCAVLRGGVPVRDIHDIFCMTFFTHTYSHTYSFEKD